MRIKAALTALMLMTSCVAPAHAEPTMTGAPVVVEGDFYAYPSTLHGANPANIPLSVTIERRETHYADVMFHNELTSWSAPDDITFKLPDGMEVRVILYPHPGDTPDVMQVFVPAGFYAYPEFVEVKEGETMTIEIREYVLG